MIILSKSNVTIKLISNQTDGINSDQSEIITQGFFEKKSDRYIISYTESEVTGFDGSNWTFCLWQWQSRFK